MKVWLTALCAVVMLAPVPAAAVTIVHSFSVVGSNFVLQLGDGSISPIEPATIDFSVTFDNALDYVDETAGLTFSSNLPYAAKFAYDHSTDLFTLATDPYLTGVCINPANSFCIFADHFSATPHVFFFEQSTATGGYYTANTIDVSEPTPGVPEPATWALVIGGFGAVGAAMRRRFTQGRYTT